MSGSEGEGKPKPKPKQKKVTGIDIAALIHSTSINNQAPKKKKEKNQHKQNEEENTKVEMKVQENAKSPKVQKEAENPQKDTKTKKEKREFKKQQKNDESKQFEKSSNSRPNSSDVIPDQRSSSPFKGKRMDQNKLLAKLFDFQKGALTGDLKSLEHDKDTKEEKTKQKMREITCSKVTMPIKILDKDDFKNGEFPLDKMVHECVLNELVDMFDLLDIKGVEYLSTYDLVSAYASMGMEMDERDCQIIVQELDKHGNGIINFSDFHSAMYDEIKAGTTEEEIKFLFNSIDVDKKGYLDVDDMKMLFKKCGDLVSTLDLQEMLNEADVKDGRIDFETFDVLCRRNNIYSKMEQ